MVSRGKRSLLLLGGASLLIRVSTGVLSAEVAAPARPSTSVPPAVLVLRPFSGPAAGGTAVSLYGGSFQPGATVVVGGVPAVGVAVQDATRIEFTMPALAAGMIHDVTVTNPGPAKATLRGAWFASFLDVPPSQIFRRQIEKLRRRRITGGCGAGTYCPDDPVTRAQMAIFILRGKHGSGYHPPAATGLVFDDVPKASFGADWIEEFSLEGITSGCGVKTYCPNLSVTRGEMAVFLLRAKLGSTHNPPIPTGKFSDVPPAAPFAKWIEELAARAITSGCGGGKFCPTVPSSRGQMAVFLNKTFTGPAQELIAEDLSWGDIDYPTSLLYRFYALFWDRRLPARYDSAVSSGEDSNLLDEALGVFADLTPAQQDSLAPFLARPDDPASVFGTPGSPAMVRRPADVVEPDTQCATAWIGTSAPGSHFKVHLCSSADPAADTALRASVNQVADDLWTPMTAAPPLGMGPPKADCAGGAPSCPGGDDKIDIYLLATDQCRDREGRCELIGGDAVAMAIPAAPFTAKTSSGYILLDRNRAGDPENIKSDFAHEFFHVLQNAHNLRAKSVDSGVRIGGEVVWDKSWFTEASATWAEWRFEPSTAPDQVYGWYDSVFQPDTTSLLTTTPVLHPYGAFVWPFFVQQEKGKADAIFQAWVAAEAASDPAGITDAVDAQFPFAEHFRDFAVRNVDKVLSGNPFVPYQAQDSGFPEELPGFTNRNTVGAVGSVTVVPVEIVALAAQYDDIVVDDPTVRKFVLRFEGIPDADVDLVTRNRVSGVWKHIPVGTQPVVFCRDIPDEDVSRVYVILSNHDKSRGNLIGGSYEIERRASCCDFKGATAWTGHVQFTYSHSAPILPGFTTEVSHTGDMSADLSAIQLEPDVLEFTGDNLTGTGSIHDREIFTTQTNFLDGDGPPLVGSSMDLLIDPVACTYTFSVGMVIDASPGFGNLGVLLKKTKSSMKDADTALEGSGSFLGRDTLCDPETSCDIYSPGGLAPNFFPGLGPGESAGAADVTWTFTPVLPDESARRSPSASRTAPPASDAAPRE